MLVGKGDRYIYRPITLPNGIRVLLSHDPAADKAAVAMSVKVGSYSDPIEHMGMAHFLEHMLFMGTEEYPDENAYMEYIHMNGGNSNANTADEVTNYFYDIDPVRLRKSMEMFSGFFKSPLIREDALTRELQAVNSEYSVNILAEIWRRYHLFTLIAKKDSPTGKFNIGSSETLASTTREDLMNFWKCFYRPERMCLAVHGSEPLDVLEKWVNECFSDIKPYEAEYSWSDKMYLPPICQKKGDLDYRVFNEEVENKVILYRPAVNLNTEHCTMTISIVLPESITNYRNKTCVYIDELLNGTGHSGLVGTLLKEGIATKMTACLDETSINTTIQIVIELVDDNRSQISVIRDLVHHYLEMIKTNATSELYNVFKTISEKEFDANESIEPLELVEHATKTMQFYPTEEFLRHEHIWDGFNKEEFDQIIGIMLDKSKWVIMYQAKNVHDPENIIVDKFYGINYLIDVIPEENVQLLSELKSKIEWSFNVPEEKDLSEARKDSVSVSLGCIPKNIPEYPDEAAAIMCKDICQQGCSGYLVHNPKYRKNAEIKLILETDEHLADEKTYAAAIGYFRAFVKIFNEKYKFGMMASIVTLGTCESVYGFGVKFNGTPVIIEDLVERFFNEYTARDTQLFSLAKESALSCFLHEARQSPYKSTVAGISYLAGYPKFDVYKLMQAAKELLPDDLVVISKAQVKVLGVGNITEKEFEHIIARIGKYITFAPHEFSFTPKEEKLLLPTVDLQNIAVTIVHRVVLDSLLQSIATGVLLAQIFSEKFFDELRTKEEYGYIVFMSYKICMKKVYVHFTVQSTRTLDNVTARIEEFIGLVESRLAAISDDEYTTHKNSAILAIKEEAINLEDYSQELFRYWQDMGFNLENKEIISKEIQKISKENITEYSKNMSNRIIIQATKP
ncbi:uncharacterized protein NEPG_01698 [Nematocida parisii ERTm1]|uniref:Insulysin n=1 Tax=Nematocida parisii (strain ERTm3) TaxID=935791 RepID=I3EIP3_NEMP3|nr:uncharacterized protein NEPG_01698 [Nematocida parisii ERTm1]EIJ89090.1 hypothetical protein NEQG_00909 [Nematocida parisii ERTm3]EIJ93356.1 hypothetical protein NEPG_01698 [Nematocida parisii ERTm1]|eukprot:XP_013059526.1 hypothetical protein NEPG_01698 [Nematocida parisii ERTm1]